MIPADASRVIQLLIERTNSRVVTWATAEEAGVPSLSSGNDFVASWPDYSVNVFSDDEADGVIVFHILNSAGKQSLSFGVAPGDSDYDTMRELFEAAERSARGADEAIEYLEKVLA